MYKFGAFFISGLFFLFGYQRCHSQDLVFNFKHFKITEDANSNYLTGIEKDQDGFFWLSSKNGLFRFDGSDFEPFGSKSSPFALKDLVVNEIKFSNNRIYAATESGISVFNTKNYTTERFDAGASEGLAVSSISIDSSGNVYWITDDGYLNLSKNGKVARRKIPRDFISAEIFPDFGRQVLLLSNEILMMVEPQTLEISGQIQVPGETGFARFLGEINGRVFLLREKAIYFFEKNSAKLVLYRKFIKEVNDAIIRGNEMYVIHDGNTLMHYYSKSENESILVDSIGLSISSPIFLSGIYDFGNQLMIRSTNGLFILNIKPRLFKLIYSVYDSAKKTFYDPRGIAELNKQIYMFSYRRSAVYEHGKGIVASDVNKKPFSAHAVLRDKDTMWIACQGDGLVKYIPALQKEEFFPAELPDDPGEGLTSIYDYGNDKFLLGSYSGLLMFDKRKHIFSRADISMSKWKKSRPFVESIIGSDGGSFIIATTKGTYLINKHFVVERLFSPNDGNSLSDQAHALWLSPNGLLWVGTSNGLFCYDIEGKLIRHITTRQGLAGNRIASVLPDREGNLWVGTFSGLSCIRAKDKGVVNFYTDAGLPDNEFNHSSALLISTGEIVMGTVKGFVIFDPASSLRLNQRTSNVTFSKIVYGTSNGETTDYSPDENSGMEILMGKEINYLKIHLGMRDVPFLTNMHFEYKINGVHENWQPVSRENIIRLDNLKPGNYILQVRDLIEGDESLAQVREVSLKVRQYFFNSVWFYVLILMVIFSLIFWNLRTSLIEERRGQQLRRVISRNLHDEVGSYLTGISMNLDLLRKKFPEVNKYQQSISLLSKKAMVALKDGLWSLDSETDKGELFWDRLKVIAREMFEPLDLEYKFGNSEIIAGHEFSGLQKNQLAFVVKECFTNALKYGKDSPVSILCKWINGHPAIQISNLKSGFDDETPGFQGLINIRARMDEIGGEVEISEDEHNFIVILHLKFLK